MPELGFMLYLLALSYGLGHFWYSILDHPHDHWMRLCAYPFLGIIAGEALFARTMPAGPEFYGVHVLIAFVATLVATLVDKGIHSMRPAHEASVRPAHA